MDEMTFLSRKYLACSLCDLHGAVEYAGATTARCSGDQVAAVGRGRATGVVVDPPVQVEDDVVAEAWRRDEEAATSQCSGWHWWQLPVAVSPSLSIGLGLGRRGTLILGWASPIRTRVKVGPVVGLARWRSILIFSPLVSPLYFKISQFELNSLLSL